MKGKSKTNAVGRISLGPFVSLEDKIKMAVRSFAGLHPVAGILAAAWREYDNKKSLGRIGELLKGLIERMQAIESARKDEVSRVVNSDEFPGLVEGAARKVQAEHQAEKRKKILNCTYNLLFESGEASFDEKVLLLELTSELTLSDFAILARFLRSPLKVADLLGAEYRKMEQLRNDKILSTTIGSLSKLQSRALVAETDSPAMIEVRNPWKESNHWGNRWVHRWFTITPLGNALLKRVDDGQK